MSKSPQPWLSYRRQCQQTLHPTSAHSDCEQSLQPIDWQGQPAACLPGGSGPKDVYTSGGFMGHVVHLQPIPQHPMTPGHKAFRSQLTANELGGIRFAGVGPKWSTVQPRSARANLLWQPRALGIWGSISSHEDPTPIGDAGCPWEWPPTDVTPRDITLEGLPPPSPFGNGEVLGILSAAISSNVLENMAILSSASWNRLGVNSLIHWSWNMSHFAFLKNVFCIFEGHNVFLNFPFWAISWYSYMVTLTIHTSWFVLAVI